MEHESAHLKIYRLLKIFKCVFLWKAVNFSSSNSVTALFSFLFGFTQLRALGLCKLDMGSEIMKLFSSTSISW